MKALVICRDNIGDIILTTPLIRALSEELHYHVDILVNSYNLEVIANNPHIKNIFIYTKLHHRNDKQSIFKILLDRLYLLITIRKNHYDSVIIAKGTWDKRALGWVKFSGAEHIIALGKKPHAKITDLIRQSPSSDVHFVEHFHRMLAPLGQVSPPGKLELQVDPSLVALFRTRYCITGQQPVIALQISARKVSQRWPSSHFIALANRIKNTIPCRLLLFWSPGAADNPRHPGDDLKAAQIAEACSNISLVSIPTLTLKELFAAMSLCDLLVSSDGGAMHVGAALDKPVVALFGDSDPGHWAPWQVPHIILQAHDNNVSSVSVNDVFLALINLLADTADGRKRGDVLLRLPSRCAAGF